MRLNGDFIRDVAFVAVVGIFLGWLIYKTVKQAEEPSRMIVRWVLTVIMLIVLFGVVGKVVAMGGYVGAFIGIPLTAACGIVLAAIWRHAIGALIARPFVSLYDGGSTPPEPQPAYSVARSRQKQGRYLEAVAEVRRQLARFPTDVEGHLLLAEIQADNLQDLPGAELTIQHFVSQPNHAPKNIAFALYSLADWHIKRGQDPEAARRALEKIIELLPNSEFALGAAQRIAHLGNLDLLLAPADRKKFAVPEGVHSLGLLVDQDALKRSEVDEKRLAADYVRHLQQHPLDTDAREKLAVIYADTFHRLDLATEQLDQLIAQPNQPAKLVVRWLNLLADLQARGGADYQTVSQTLQRIVDRDPNVAAAEVARKRLALLRLELKANEKSQAVKLGSYEQNIGLKQGLPRH